MAVVYNNYLTQAKKYYEEARKKAKEDQNKIFEEQVSVVNDTYGKAINDAKIDYEDMHRENAIQKLINENEVAEDMANMGLEGSGLNRTQATAVQLSYANNRSSIERQKQAQVDSIAQKLAQELSTIKQNRIATISAIDKEYDSAAVSAAQDAYKEALDAETARIKENNRHIEKMASTSTGIISRNNGILNRGFLGSLSENGVSVKYDVENGTTTYIDRNTGYKSTFNRDTNPYTNTVNPDTKYGTFDNGYQPNNIGGKKVVDTGLTAPINGRNQKVFIIGGTDRRGNANYYVWDGIQNKYTRAYEENGDWVIYR